MADLLILPAKVTGLNLASRAQTMATLNQGSAGTLVVLPLSLLVA